VRGVLSLRIIGRLLYICVELDMKVKDIVYF
jgi:hypothetical protein